MGRHTKESLFCRYVRMYVRCYLSYQNSSLYTNIRIYFMLCQSYVRGKRYEHDDDAFGYSLSLAYFTADASNAVIHALFLLLRALSRAV